MNEEIRMKEGDLLPEVFASLSDTGGLISMSGVTAKFIMTPVTSTTAKINTTATPLDPPVLVNGILRNVKYTWAGTDTDTAGRYKAEFEATIAGKKFTAPNDTYITVLILPDLA